MRLVRVAEASAPEDFNICDIAPGGYGPRLPVQSSKFSGADSTSPAGGTRAIESESPYRVIEIAALAGGARTLVRRRVGWRRGFEASQRASAVTAFLRDKSRVPGEFLVCASA